jgi:ribosome-binding protein aMBF1 (putative translation factor)
VDPRDNCWRKRKAQKANKNVCRYDHVVPIYKNHEPLCITFTISRHPTETLGQFLKKLRLEKGLEQRELVKKLRVNKSSVYEWENDRKKPSRQNVEKLARFFKISIKRLKDFKREGKKERY